ncbi:MAG TPA: AMP-binding protein [Jatrophihabitans sp.]|nr:AMP-binding protein [Jatrophihabitans sp.]
MSTLLAALQRTATEHAERLAVVETGRRWTYRQLAAHAYAVAEALVEAGSRAGDHVLLSMHPDGAGIAAMWGCWLAGTSFVPINARAPQARNQQIADLTGAQQIISDREVKLTGLCRVRMAEPRWTRPGELSSPTKADTSRVGQPGYVIFTSGSTGTPKGVVVDGGALLAHCAALIDFERLSPETVSCQFHELSFDAAQQYLWSGLLAGACQVAKPIGTLPPARLVDFLREWQVSSAHVAARYLVIMAGAGVLDREPPDTLRTVTFGGEPLPIEVVRQFQRSRWREIELINYYGPTEGVIAVTGYRLPMHWDPVPEARSVPVGEALGGRRVEVWPVAGQRGQSDQPASSLAESTEPVVGELVVLGQPRAVGYLGIHGDDRFSGSGQDAVLRTGDLAVYRPGQGYEILGRLDDQVKVSGYRIDLGEVECVLREAPGVADLAVVALRTDFDTALGACLVPQAGVDAEQVLAEVRRRADALLPYQRPARYLLADNLPLTGNGKADRARLVAELAAGGR